MAIDLTSKYMPGVGRAAITAASTWEIVNLAPGVDQIMIQFADSGDTSLAGRVALDNAGTSGDYWSVAAGQSLATPVARTQAGVPYVYVYCATASAYVQAVVT